MKKTVRSVLALLLCLVMCLGMLPAGIVSAAEPEQAAPAIGENPYGADVEVVIDDPSIPIFENPQYTFAERAADLVARMSLTQKGSMLVENSPAILAENLTGGTLNVPATKDLSHYCWWSEALHGFLRDNEQPQTDGSRDNVSYVQSMTIASTWNPELYYEGAVEIANEIRERAVKNELGNCINLEFYSPTINMQRDPRWGRNEESYSEDPLLVSTMATQFVLGMEGKDQSGNIIDPSGYKKTLTTIKHYVANNTEAIRQSGGATSDLRALREYFAAPYRDVIAATDVSSVMTAYSSFNEEPCSYSSYLMDTILRQTYGFTGFITSDCDSVSTMSNLPFINPRTGEKLTQIEQWGGALAHGEDLECNSGGRTDYRRMAKSIVESSLQTDMGTFTENTLDISAHRLLTARISTGELDENNPYTIAANERKADQEARGLNNYTPERIDIVDRQAREGVVLLKNENNLLPLQIPAEGDDYSIVIIGNWAHQENDKGDRNHKFYLGLYSSEQRFEQDDKWRIDIQTGINTAVHAINPNITPTYLMKDTVDAADEEILKAADAVIVVVGTNNSYSAEGRDRSSIALPNGLDTFIANVGKLNENTIAVMETCGPMQVTKFENDVAAILWSSYGGIRKGTGFGEVITGATNPSGHLTSTWHQNDADMPGIRDYNLYATDGNHGRTYMYYDNWVPVSYPFGYGLSYTSFAYSNLTIDKTAYDANDTVKVTFDVTNTGDVAGKEVTQLYIAQPEAPAELLRPIRRLEGFQKIALQPGETKTVELEVKIPDLAFYNEEADCFMVDTGLYQVQVGEDSTRANLTADFTVTGEMDEYPVFLNVKANQVGDEALGIESRIIFDKGATVNPQLTVAMNNEKLYGYIIADQQDLVKSLESCPLPEGMTFEYHSNRPSVAAVTADGIKAVAPGVATITVTGEMNGHTVTTDFVVYVEANAEIDAITVDGKPLEGFARDQFTYELDYSGSELPVIGAISANDDLEITVNQLTSLPGVAEVVSVSKSTGTTCVYRIGAGPAPVSTDFAEGWAAAEAKNWMTINANANSVFGENGLSITTEQGAIGAEAKNLYLEPGFGAWVAQTHMTLDAAIAQDGPQAGLVVYDDDSNYLRYVLEQVTTSSWGRVTVSQVLRAYAVSNGEETQIASVTLTAPITELFLQVIKRNKTYGFRYSLNGTDWVDVAGTTALKMAYPRLGVYASGSKAEGLNPVAVTFDGIGIFKVSDLYPRLSSITDNGEQIGGFDPECFVYNYAIERDDAAAHLIAAAAADPEHEVTVEQMDGSTGMAVITVASGAANAQYRVSYNYRPESEYFADGALSSDWAILNEDAEGYAIEKGAGVVLPTQYGDIRAADAYTASWKNLFVAPAMGNAWEIVTKVVFPAAPKANTQMNQFLVFQDDANYVFASIQNPLRVVYGSETDDVYTSNNSGWFFTGPSAVAAADGSLTVYFSIKNKGDSYTLAWSQDGRTFSSLGTVSNVNLANPKIGLFATERSTAEPIDVQYEYVAVTSLDTVEQMNYSQMLSWAAGNVAEYVAADIPAETAENIVFDAIPHGYTMDVVSSDPDVIAADGTVTPAAATKNVTLTITIAEGDVTASATRTVKVPGTEAAALEDIDFTDPASADRFEVENQASTAIREGEGLYMISTKDVFEPEGTPKDVVKIPVGEEDWTATLQMKVSTGSGWGWGRSGECFGFYAMDDYNNFAGIRAAMNQMQDIVRKDGEITAAQSNATPGLSSYNNRTIFLRIVKSGDDYACSISTDGGYDYSPLFSLEDTGVNGGMICLDAYSTNSVGYNYLLDNMSFAAAKPNCEHEYALDAASAAPTCTAAGTNVFVCAKCGKSYTESVPATGHVWGDAEIVIQPGVDTFGERVVRCTVDGCDASKTTYILPTNYELKAGPTLLEDESSPTGYTARFIYFNDTAKQVYFCGDLMLGNHADPTDTKNYRPEEYKPGLMRRGGVSYKEAMKELADGYWFYELPLCAGANQYWFNIDNNSRMQPDPANHPIWSPNSDENSKNAYNCLYVPYCEKQAYAPLQAREVELPRESEDKGTWSYVPYTIGSATHYMAVYLPYGYDAEREKPYKTIYLIHGSGQDESDWMGIGSVQNTMDNLIAEGRAEAAVLVSLSLNNGAIGDQNTRFASLFDVVLPYVEENYNVSTKVMDRSISGLSMGSRYSKYIMEVDAQSFGYFGLYSCMETIKMETPNLDKAHIFVGVGQFEAANYVNATNTNITNLEAADCYYAFERVAGAHDFNTWNQLFRIYVENYLWNPEAFGDVSHVHSYTAAVTAPTCTEAGFTTYTCECGESYVADEVAALGHDYADGVCTRCGEEAPHVGPIKIGCIGDSITYGHNPADGGRTQIKENWPKVLGDLLGSDYEVRNFGQNGTTLMNDGQIVYRNQDIYTQSLAYEADIYIFMLGTNDSNPAQNWNKQEAFKEQMIDLIGTYQALPSKPQVYVCTAATAFHDGNFSIRPYNIHDYIVPLQREVAAELGLPVIDIHELTAPYPEMFPDEIHPNEEGCQLIAQEVYASLITPADHEHDWVETVVAPTCTEPGYSIRACAGCVRTRVFDRTAATGHIWDAGVVTKEATTAADGVKTFACTVCDATKTVRIPRIGSKVPADIDFSDPADADKYEIVNQASSAIVINEGLSLVSTTNSSPEAAGEAFNPSDLISIPVDGNFSATLKFNFTGGGFSFFGDTDLLGFYLMDDNDNGVGIRAGNRALLNLVKKDGVVTTADAAIGESTTAGLTSAATHWFRIDKSGDNVTAAWSTDGESFTDLFVFEATGLEGQRLVIDAYNTSAWAFGGANSYILETMNFTEKEVSPFEDVEPGAFYYDAVKWAVDNGITTGTEEGLFAPDLAVTRAQIVTFLWRAAGCPEPETVATFKDLRAGAYYSKAVAWAVENGITNGMGKNMFAPDDICTRGQIVTFLWRYMKKPAASAPAAFTDVVPDAFYADAVAWAVEAGVTTGITEELFKPDNDATRGQAVTFIQRAIAE